MISEQEWGKLKAGDDIYIAYLTPYLSNKKIITTTVKRITKKQLMANEADGLYQERFNSSSKELFTSKSGAVDYFLNSLKNEKDRLLKNVDEINSKIRELEQENG